MPLGEVQGVGPKYRFLSERKDQFNLIFLGSSRVFHHFLPEQFDEQVAKNSGTTLKSFNFGYDAMWPPESFYMLRKVLALRPAHLRWVLIDLMQIHPKFDVANVRTMRAAYWHDWRHTLMAWRALGDERLPFSEKMEIAATHGEHLLNQWTNRGRCAEWLDKTLHQAETKRPKPKGWETTGGFEAGDDKVMAGAELKEFERSVAVLRKSLAPARLRPTLGDAITEIIAEVRSIGAEPIFVLAPTLDPRENVTELPGDVEILSFADPNQYPALYDASNHYDGWHLNEKGARIFTELLAERFGSLLHKTGSAVPSAPASK